MSDHVTTRYEMLRAGYRKLSDSKCKSCGAPIEWWQTNNGKKMPFDPLPASEHEQTRPHWASCPHADDHRQGSGSRPQSKSVPHASAQQKLDGYQRHLAAFRASSNARVVIAIYDDGSAVAWRKGLPAEDLRHELITEANSLRNHLDKE
jgi:hypothetical protein